MARSMSERMPEYLFSSVHQAMGAASMAWIPVPSTEVFDSTRAADIALELCRDVADWHEAEVATLTTERDAAEESRRFYMAERDRLREALEAQGFQAGRHGWHSLLCMGYTGQECRAECTKAREAFARVRALAGTGETPSGATLEGEATG